LNFKEKRTNMMEKKKKKKKTPICLPMLPLKIFTQIMIKLFN